MKRVLKVFLLILIMTSMVLSTFACGSSGDGKKDPGKEGDKEKASGIYLDPAKWKGKVITIASTKATLETETGEPNDVVSNYGMTEAGRKLFGDKTGAQVNLLEVPEGQDNSNWVITQVAAGMGPDLTFMGTYAKPSWMIKNILQPLDPYIDFNQPKYQDNTIFSNQVLNYYSWAGKHYAVGKLQHGARMYYNKEKFVNAGLEDPLELWKQDKWTWEKFWELGAALTQDTDGDGVMDQYGYCTWFFENGFMTSNNVEYVMYDETGMPRFALDDRFVKAKQAADDTVNKYKIAPSVWWDPNPQERFVNGEIAMDYWGYWDLKYMHENMGEKLGMAPFPRGPDLPADRKNNDVAECIGFGITSTSKNPELAALYIEWNYEYENTPENKSKVTARWSEMYGSQELYELGQEWAKNSVVQDYSGYGQSFSDALGLILNKPMDKSWQQAIDENKAACQKAIDDSIVNMK